ncbi:hypothetical protein GO285_01404 [Ralstonia solanacearum]|nr:hypothetical protein [Ralstonia solanacearum]NKG09630.1 hypothetical protein [Ralstonia solanacearum]
MIDSDDDWSGIAVANDAQPGDDFRTRLVASGLVPQGHVVVRIALTLRSTHIASKTLKAPFVTAFLFDAGGHPDPQAAFRAAKATGNLDLKTVNIQLSDTDALDIFRDLTVDLMVRGFDLGDEQPPPQSGQLF